MPIGVSEGWERLAIWILSWAASWASIWWLLGAICLSVEEREVGWEVDWSCSTQDTGSFHV